MTAMTVSTLCELKMELGNILPVHIKTNAKISMISINFLDKLMQIDAYNLEMTDSMFIL